MKKFITFSLICILSGFMAIACQRDRGVFAGNDSDTYQPRPAHNRNNPTDEHAGALNGNQPLNQDAKGELTHLDLAGKTFGIRLEKGMEQTFKFDDTTVLTGLENSPPPTKKASKNDKSPLRNLSGKEGSELTVRWRDENGLKMATNIEVTQVITARRGKRH